MANRLKKDKFGIDDETPAYFRMKWMIAKHKTLKKIHDLDDGAQNSTIEDRSKSVKVVP